MACGLDVDLTEDPGLLPGWASLTNGDVQAKRKMTWEMLHGFFRAVFSPDPVSGKPFAADAIISNPPAFAHCHVAEAFGLPLHMTFSRSHHASISHTSYALVSLDSICASIGQHTRHKRPIWVDECTDIFLR